MRVTSEPRSTRRLLSERSATRQGNSQTAISSKRSFAYIESLRVSHTRVYSRLVVTWVRLFRLRIGAIHDLSAEPLIAFLTQEMAAGVRKHFEGVLAARVFPGSSIDAARRYVRAYVEFIHYVEHVYEALGHPMQGENAPPSDHEVPD